MPSQPLVAIAATAGRSRTGTTAHRTIQRATLKIRWTEGGFMGVRSLRVRNDAMEKAGVPL